MENSLAAHSSGAATASAVSKIQIRERQAAIISRTIIGCAAQAVLVLGGGDPSQTIGTCREWSRRASALRRQFGWISGGGSAIRAQILLETPHARRVTLSHRLARNHRANVILIV